MAVKPTGALKEALAQLEPVLPDYELGVEKVAALKERRAALLPLEEEAGKRFDAHLRSVQRGYSPFIAEGYRVLPLEVLKWRGSDHYPSLALYSINSAKRLFTAGSYGVPSSTPALPAPIFKCYADLFNLLARERKSITATFSGVLPDDIRALILKETNKTDHKRVGKRFKELFILAEAQWKVASLPAPPPVVRRDPFLLGWDGNDLWHLASFDLTPVEEYVKQEFIVKS